MINKCLAKCAILTLAVSVSCKTSSPSSSYTKKAGDLSEQELSEGHAIRDYGIVENNTSRNLDEKFWIYALSAESIPGTLPEHISFSKKSISEKGALGGSVPLITLNYVQFPVIDGCKSPTCGVFSDGQITLAFDMSCGHMTQITLDSMAEMGDYSVYPSSFPTKIALLDRGGDKKVLGYIRSNLNAFFRMESISWAELEFESDQPPLAGLNLQWQDLPMVSYNHYGNSEVELQYSSHHDEQTLESIVYKGETPTFDIVSQLRGLALFSDDLSSDKGALYELTVTIISLREGNTVHMDARQLRSTLDPDALNEIFPANKEGDSSFSRSFWLSSLPVRCTCFGGGKLSFELMCDRWNTSSCQDSRLTLDERLGISLDVFWMP